MNAVSCMPKAKSREHQMIDFNEDIRFNENGKQQQQEWVENKSNKNEKELRLLVRDFDFVSSKTVV